MKQKFYEWLIWIYPTDLVQVDIEKDDLAKKHQETEAKLQNIKKSRFKELKKVSKKLCSKIEKQKQIISEVQQGLKSAAQHEEYYRSKVRKLEDSIVDRIDALMRCRCRAVSWAVYV